MQLYQRSAIVITNLCQLGCVFQRFPNFRESYDMTFKTKQKWVLTRFCHESWDAVCICHVYYFPYQVLGWTGGLIVIVTQNRMSVRYSCLSKPELIRQILIWNTGVESLDFSSNCFTLMSLLKSIYLSKLHECYSW